MDAVAKSRTTTKGRKRTSYVRIQDRVGMRYGMLVVTGLERRNGSNYLLRCKCDCGQAATVWLNQIAAGRACDHCGCQFVKNHPLFSQLYACWSSMKDRCYHESSSAYANYGGRGIRVSDRWLNSFEAFAEDVGPRPSPLHSLDRWPDNDGNYEPGNVRWATSKQQSRNRRSNRRFDVAGVHHMMTDWAAICGITRERMRQRFNAFTPERAVLFYESARKYLSDRVGHAEVARMAEIVEWEISNKPKSVERYPWAEWLDGNARKLFIGTDFDCDLTKFAGVARAAAKKHGVRIRTRLRHESGYILLQAIAPPPTGPGFRGSVGQVQETV